MKTLQIELTTVLKNKNGLSYECIYRADADDLARYIASKTNSKYHYLLENNWHVSETKINLEWLELS